MIKDHSNKLHAALSESRELCESFGYVVADAMSTGSASYGKETPGDYDALIYVEYASPFHVFSHTLAKLANFSESLGWEDCANEVTQEQTSGGDCDDTYYKTWVGLRKGDYNAIITNDRVWFLRMAAATALVRNMSRHAGHALDKARVVAIFRAVREGE